MSTNSKINPLILITIAVIAIFIAAIFYKNSNVDNSEQVYVPKVDISKTNTVKTTNKKEYDFNKLSDIPAKNSEENPFANLTIEEREKKVSANLHKYTNYRTPEQVMETIYKYKELGMEKEAEEYIDFLIKRFPDYEMQ